MEGASSILKKKKQKRNILHYPRLDTVMMVEKTIREAEEYLNKRQLWKSLPKKIMYQTFLVILDYLRASGKIVIDREGKIVWIYDPEGVKRIMQRRGYR